MYQPNLKEENMFAMFFLTLYVGTCHHDMTHPRVADGGDSIHIWTVAVTADKG